MRKLNLTLVFLIAIFSHTLATSLELVKKAQSGKSPRPTTDYSIYIERNAPSSVKLAAKELQRTIEISTGLRLLIVNKPISPMISLGVNTATRKAGFSTDSLSDDSFRILTEDKNIYIYGKDTQDNYRYKGWESRGTLFGVYEFLEKVIGVRWLMPGEVGEEIPKHKSITVPEMDLAQKPSFEGRYLLDVQNQIRSYNINDSGPQKVDRWLLRQKIPNVSYGFKKTRPKVHYGHAWIHYITPKDMKDHPKWHGKSSPIGKFCTSNPEAVKFFAERVIEYFDENPDVKSATISPEDGGNFCQCDSCLALTEKDWHGKVSYTPVILKFYNDVAKIVAKKYPKRMLGGYVYYNYMYPPSKPMKIEPNVHLFLAPLNYYGWGLAKPVYAKELDKLIAGWTALTKNFHYINWSVWFRAFTGTPLSPGLPILKLEMPTLKKHGVKGVSMIGIGAWGYGGCENYIMAKLMWDADSDVDNIYKEWLQKAYGPAWKVMDEFYMTIEKRILARKLKESPRYSGDNYEVNYDFVDDVYKPIFPKLEELYTKAMSLVKTEKQRKRLEMLGDNLIMLHYNMRNAKMLKDPEKSRFYTADKDYVNFIKNTVFSLSLYRDHGHRDLPPLYDGSFSGQGENPPMEIRELVIPKIKDTASKPVIDGDLSDEIWKNAAKANKFRKLGEKSLVSQQTEARLLYDNDNLYMSIICHDDAPDKIRADEKQRDENVFADDCIEIFLATFPNSKTKSWHLALNAANTQWDGIGAPRLNLKWISAAQKTDKGWCAEIAIPFKELGYPKAPDGKNFRANLCRSQKSKSENSTWNASYKRFNEPYSFGKWNFTGGK